MGARLQILKAIEIEDRVLCWANSWGGQVVDTERKRQRANDRWSMADDMCPFYFGLINGIGKLRSMTTGTVIASPR